MANEKSSKNGQFMTPPHIVNTLLTLIHPSIHNKIMEPSFGTGNFLMPILQSLINQTLTLSRQDAADAIAASLYGIEYDQTLYQTAISRLKVLLNQYKIPHSALKNLIQANTLEIWEQYKNQMDIIIGNPPFIRIHHLSDNQKAIAEKLKFTKGITDSYVIFTELAINMLNDNGQLLFIVPSTVLTNVSIQPLIQYCKNNIKTIVFLPNTIFGANVRTCCLHITKGQQQKTQQSQIDECGLLSAFTPYQYPELEKIAESPWHNGIATNADKIFIGTIIPNETDSSTVYFTPNNKEMPVLIEKSALKKAIKGSKAKWMNEWIIYLYDKTEQECPMAYKYLQNHRNILDNRDTNQPYYLYGRTQGLGQVGKKKWVFNPYIAPTDIVPYIYEIDENSIVYAGLYALKEELPNPRILLSDKFMSYARQHGRQICGEYIVVSSRILNAFYHSSQKHKEKKHG